MNKEQVGYLRSADDYEELIVNCLNDLKIIFNVKQYETRIDNQN